MEDRWPHAKVREVRKRKERIQEGNLCGLCARQKNYRLLTIRSMPFLRDGIPKFMTYPRRLSKSLR